ncbi:conserved hypothetical protein [Gammaproteobacteria bacterium]
MTAQATEKLYYEGLKVGMCSEPLELYFLFSGESPKFDSHCSGLWRGYVGTWKIKDGRLYLIELQGWLEDGNNVTLATLFPDFPDRVFAHWYSGTIRIPQGKILNYVHMGYESTYEKDILLKIEKGVVTDTTVRYNGTSNEPDAAESYGISTMARSK